MKNIINPFIVLLLFFTSYNFLYSQEIDLSDKATKNRIKYGISILASDSLMGREAGTKGEIMAVEFISAEFEKIGLNKYIGDSSYLQYFDFKDGEIYKNGTSLTINGKEYLLNKDFFPLSISANKQVTGTIVYANEGIIDTLQKRNDFLNKNVKDPIFVVEMTKDSRSEEFLPFLIKKAENAIKHNAKGLVIINNNVDFKNPRKFFKDTVKTSKIPVIFIDEDAKKIVQEKKILKANLKVNFTKNIKKGINVVGNINNYAENTIIVGAHFDHLGMGGRASRYKGKEKLVHNGADDNASGVMGLLELARYIKSKKNLKKYNYIFIAFSAEEKGLIGSSRFANSTLYNPNKINCMINLDMIGRIDSTTHKLYIFGTGTSPSWDTLLKNVPLAKILNIKKIPSGIGGSDHSSFYLKKIPSLFFFSGMHNDYHKPSDDIETLNYKGEVTILNYIEQLIEALNQKEKLIFTETKNNSKEKNQHSGVTMGFMPDFSYNGKGVKINAIVDNKPADKAGLKKGDVILKVKETEIIEINSYMKALKSFKKGNTTEITIKRNNKIETKKITF